MKKKREHGLDPNLKYEDLDDSVDWIVSLIRRECFTPYFVENWIMILDADGLSMMSFPVGFFTNLLKLTQVNHPACLHKMYIVNPPFGVSALFTIAAPFLGSDTKVKIQILSKKEFPKMLELIDADQLLDVYGGTLKLPTRVWPPVDTYSAQDRPERRPVNQPLNASNNPYVFDASLNRPKRGLYGDKKKQDEQA